MLTFAWQCWPSYFECNTRNRKTAVSGRIVEARDKNEQTLIFSRLLWQFPIYKTRVAGSPGRVEVATEIVPLATFPRHHNGKLFIILYFFNQKKREPRDTSRILQFLSLLFLNPPLTLLPFSIQVIINTSQFPWDISR